ncbi:MAG TPA: hypothetical protein VIY48_05080 [Candidatus Paceibacterota bacterium]
MTRDITVNGSNPDKATIADTDRFPMTDSESTPQSLKEVVFSLIKSTLKTYFDTVYILVSNTAKGSIVDGDSINIVDSAAGSANKQVLFSILKSTLKTYFDAIYAPITFVAYVMLASGAQFSPADATTYFFGSVQNASPTTTAAQRKIFIPKAGTIKRVDIALHNNAGVAGSGETSTMSLRLNNTTDTTLSTGITTTATSGNTTFFNVTGLSVAVVAGDFVEIKWVTPTWVTNPTNLNVDVRIYVE